MLKLLVGAVVLLTSISLVNAQCANDCGTAGNPSDNDPGCAETVNGPISVVVSPGGLAWSCICLDSGTGNYRIAITRLSGTGEAIIEVNSSSSTARIDSICLTSYDGDNHNNILIVGSESDPIRSVGSIVDLGDGVVVLEDMWLAENLGDGVASGDFAVDVDVITRVVVGASIVAPVRANPGSIGQILAENVFADVRAPFSTIAQVNASNQIGSSVSGNVQIRAMDGIGSIVADRIYADIDTRVSSGMGNLALLRTRSGSTGNIFRGSLITKSVLSASSNNGIQVYGDLDADIIIEDDVVEGIIVSGEFKPGRTLEVKDQMLNGSGNLGSLDIGTLSGTVKFTRTTQGIRGPIWIGSVSSTGRLESSSNLQSDAVPSGAVLDVNGNMAGTIQIAGNIAGMVHIGGDLDGLVTNSANLSGTLTVDGYMDGLIKVGDTFSGTIDINQSQGLRGQIIINADHMTTPGTWTGPVIVGSSTISHTNGIYTAPSAGLGGGAVGLAPFAFYDTDCTPPNNEVDPTDGVLAPEFESASPIILRWFGPIRLPTGITNPMSILKIEVEDPREGNECQWIDLSSIFTATMHPGGDQRAIAIGASPQPREGKYRVRYNGYATDEDIYLECSEVEGNPWVFFTELDCDGLMSSYMFRVLADCNENDISDISEIIATPSLDLNEDGYLDDCDFEDPCACDWDHNGQIHVPDIFDFLADWFANDPLADFDDSGTVAVPDIFAFLGCWFANACE